MSTLIETRPFTIHPELYAWPSFRLFSARILWVYVVVLVVVAILLRGGLQLSSVLSCLISIALVAVFAGASYVRYKMFLSKPENRGIFQNCVVSLSGDELRQDYSDGSHLAFKLFAITSFREVGDFYFAFATPRNAIVVPRTAFESPEESRSFANTLRETVARK